MRSPTRATAAAWRRFVVRPVLRRLRDPFEDGRSTRLVHVADHRAGTVWFGRVLSAVAQEHGLLFGRIGKPNTNTTDLTRRADMLLYRMPRDFDPAPLGAFRGSHIVRDPRDLVVSGYHYHLWTKERWAHVPEDEYGGLTFQEHLRSIRMEDGIAAEIRRSSERKFPTMGAWDYRRPEFLELRYEDVIRDEAKWFAELFAHYGFADTAIERSVAIALQRSFRAVSGRAVGATQEGSHLRSGRPGQWSDVFTPAHKDLFGELNGDLLQKLGYETGDDW